MSGDAEIKTPTPIDWESQISRTLAVENDDDSHTERDAVTFHPSQLARCKRQAALSKFGLEEHDTETLGVFQIGTLVHEWLEETFSGRIPGVYCEHSIEQEYRPDGYNGIVRITGSADVWDSHDGVVYDFKTRGGWYKFDPPSERHLDQLTLYMDALDADAGQVVYINKKNLEVRTWPEGDTFACDPDRRDDLIVQAAEMQDRIRESGRTPETVEDVPFDPCDCWLCEQEGGSDA